MQTSPFSRFHAHEPGRYATVVATFSFLAGTALFVLCRISGGEEAGLETTGLCYLTGAAVANAAILLHLIWLMIRLEKQRQMLAVRALILLSNIPVACFYLLNL